MFSNQPLFGFDCVKKWKEPKEPKKISLEKIVTKYNFWVLAKKSLNIVILFFLWKRNWTLSLSLLNWRKKRAKRDQIYFKGLSFDILGFYTIRLKPNHCKKSRKAKFFFKTTAPSADINNIDLSSIGHTGCPSSPQ